MKTEKVFKEFNAELAELVMAGSPSCIAMKELVKPREPRIGDTVSMKKSEELKKIAYEEDNDLKHLGLYKKFVRQSKQERFEDFMKQLEIYEIEVDYNKDQGRATITTSEFGIVDFYPKADRVLIRKVNHWKNHGLNWLIKHLL